MREEPVQASKLAEVDLRVLKRLYEAGSDFTKLSVEEIIVAPIEGISKTDVIIRMVDLEIMGGIESLSFVDGIAMTRLSPLARQRLEDPAPLLTAHESENWIERICWLLSTPQSPSDLIRNRDAVLARPKSFRRALARAAAEREAERQRGVSDEHVRAARRVAIDLRILITLYDAGPDFTVLVLSEILRPEIGVTIKDVRKCMLGLEHPDEVHAILVGSDKALATLSPIARERLASPAQVVPHRDDETWVERIRWLLSQPLQPSNLINARDAVLKHPRRRFPVVDYRGTRPAHGTASAVVALDHDPP
jgi:hypothetical protein